MKKLLAVTLALAMMMSMAVVSFADAGAYDDIVYDGTLFVRTSPLVLVEDLDVLASDVRGIEYGGTVYFNIYDYSDYDPDYFVTGEEGYDPDFGGDGIASHKFMEKVKIKTDFEMGEELVESVELVKMRARTEVNGGLGDEYVEYFIAVKLADKETTAESDVVGTFTISRKAIKGKDVGLDFDIDKVDDMKADFAFPVFYTRSWNNYEEYFLVEDEVNLMYDQMYALKFESDDEVELLFGGKEGPLDGEQNEGIFTVDASGQGKVFIKWNTEADEAIAAANEGVDMRFVNFGGVKFNRAGEFVYELDDAAAAYEIVDGKLVEIPGVEIEDGEIIFRTHKLGSYVFANSELVNP